MPKQPKAVVNKYPANPYTPQPEEVPDFVSEYLRMRELIELSKARADELADEVIRWAVDKIRNGEMTNKVLPIPELEAKGQELILTERKTVDKEDTALLALGEKIKREAEIAAVINRTQIKLLKANIESAQKKLDHYSQTDIGHQLMADYNNAVEEASYLKKGLTLREKR